MSGRLSAAFAAAAGLVKRGRRIFGFAGALLVGVVVGLLLWPTVQREWMYRRLFSDETIQRQVALDWWRGSAGGGGVSPSRLVEWPSIAARITGRIDGAIEQPIFIELASLLRESGYWRLPLISTNLWRRRLDLILDSGDVAAALSVIEEAAGADAARDDVNVVEVWQRLLAWPDEPGIRLRALFGAARWFDEAQTEAFAAEARGDVDASVRRAAWLLLGAVRPRSGYAGQWKGEEPAVAEAMLWAATVTNPDDASPLLVACDQSPWPTSVLPWLLSRSNDPAARVRLEALVVDGNRAAALHLAERWGAGVERLPVGQQAWLGMAPVSGSEDDLRLRRWSAWRNAAGDAQVLLDEPVAEDGSVWAAVLLAERLLDEESCEDRSRQWLNSLEPGTRAAGALLGGLCADGGWRLSEEYQESREARFRRSARLAMMMANGKIESAASSQAERAYAWTVVKTEPSERVEALLALLASGDREAAQAVLTAPSDSPAGAAMWERAWLIERFVPDYAAMVAPLCPWNDGVAALQFEIMHAAFAVGDRLSAFDAHARVFRYATATPSR